MAAINLYPPIIDSYMPAYLNPEQDGTWAKCRIYFSLSSLNSYEEISYAQLSVINQKTNKNALNTSRYPTGIKMVKLSVAEEDTGLYFIDLYVGKNAEGEVYDMAKFEPNQYYKVQIRFASSDVSYNGEVITVNSNLGTYNYCKLTSSWLNANISYFSEWSTVCLIKGLSQPTFTFTSSALNNLNPDFSTTIEMTENIPVVGTFGFKDATETDYLKSYRVTLMDSSSTTLYDDSGLLFTDSFNPNSINYLSKYLTEEDKAYTLRIDYTTNNLYSGTFSYKFTRSKVIGITLGATIAAYLNKDDDQIVIKINFDSTQKEFLGSLIIKRANSDNNFQTWENIHKVSMADIRAIATQGYLWGDITVQSGKWYKYAVQWVKDSDKSRIQYSQNIVLDKPVSLMLEEICIVGANTQVKIKYDPKISSFNYKTVQSAIETIGSKYPFIRRNGNIGYKTFNISGLITRHMDENQFFATAKDIYGNADMIDYYEEYNQENRINAYNDHTYEYLFREKVIDFLNDGKVKLFRSPSEGNLLVTLSNISITPNETLGRMVYNFSATATEVAASTVENYIDYGIVEYKDSEYLLQGIRLSQSNGYITIYLSSSPITDGDYAMNAGAQVSSASTSLILTVV